VSAKLETLLVLAHEFDITGDELVNESVCCTAEVQTGKKLITLVLPADVLKPVPK